MLTQLLELWPPLLSLLGFSMSLLATVHAVLYKRDTRATIGWVGIIWLVPILGSVLYLVFGVNRIRRRAQHIRHGQSHSYLPGLQKSGKRSQRTTVHSLPDRCAYLDDLARLVGEVSERPLLSGNQIEPLINGDQAYRSMLEAIDGAEQSVALCSYIFDNDRAGKMFLNALMRAVQRKVEVRVLIDDVGSRYSWPSMVHSLRAAGIRAATFLPTLVPWRAQYSNLRNHRKILVVDGRIGFTGGMNIREGCMLDMPCRHPVQDVHFRITGPVVAHLQEVFALDWEFGTKELLQGPTWFPDIEPAGPALARVITDGPDDDLDRLRMVILGATGCARRRLDVMTPYFLPDEALITSLNVAAMRGVEVNIILPQQNNLALVQWASTATLWQVLGFGCRVFLSPPPFDHTKLMIVDDVWAMVGSANWDPRSLRLNFELNVEVYDPHVAGCLRELVDKKLAASVPVTLGDLERQNLFVRFRDGIARLATPYL